MLSRALVSKQNSRTRTPWPLPVYRGGVRPTPAVDLCRGPGVGAQLPGRALLVVGAGHVRVVRVHTRGGSRTGARHPSPALHRLGQRGGASAIKGAAGTDGSKGASSSCPGPSRPPSSCTPGFACQQIGAEDIYHAAAKRAEADWTQIFVYVL